MELWDLGTSKPLPVKALYAVRIVLLIAPALGMVYFFTRVALFPVGAVPLVYLVVHGWLATIYRADRSVMLIYWGNAVSALLAAAMSVFFVMRFSAAGRSQRTPRSLGISAVKRTPPTGALCASLRTPSAPLFSRPGSLQLRMIR